MKRILLFAILACTTLYSYSQKTLKGKVTDINSKTPLSGATILFGGKGGVKTDKDGMFSIDCGKTNKIVVSFVGYEPATVNIQNCDDELSISLVPSSEYLNNVDLASTSAQNKTLLNQPVSITKLTLADLNRGQGIFLQEAIETSVPGVQMNRRTVSGGQQFNIRGYGNGARGTNGVNSNFDGQGYKVYINNIPLTDAEGITTLDDIDFASLGNVEILKGPAGTLYGQAISGAVSFKTLKPENGRTSISQDIMFGNYGLQRFTTRFSTGNERSGILLNYGKQKSDGFSIHNSSHKDFANLVLMSQPNEKQNFSSYVGFTDSYDERLGELTIQQWANKDYSGNPEYIKRNAHSHVVTYRAGVTHTYNFTKGFSNTSTVFGTGFRSDVSSAGGWTDKTTVNYGFRISFQTKVSVGDNLGLNGITGMEIQRQNAQTVGYNMKANPNDPNPGSYTYGVSPYWVINANTSNIAYTTQPTSFFTEWTLAFPKDLSFSAGIGYSSQKISLDDRFRAITTTYAGHFDTSYKGMWSPHLALNKIFSKQASVYASYSKGYKAPVSSYFFIVVPTTPNPTGIVNSNIKPEFGDQFEVGSKGLLLNDRLNYQLALFSFNIHNKMTAVSVPLNAGTTAYSYMVNGSTQKHKGVEASLKYAVVNNPNSVISNVTPFINFTYSDFKYGAGFRIVTGATVAGRDTIDYSGKNVYGVPKIMNALGVDVATRFGLYANLVHIYKDGMTIGTKKTSTSGPKVFTTYYTTSYNLLNGKIGFKKNLSSRFFMDIFFGVNNIGGTRYPIMIFVNQLDDAYIPAPPKAVIYGGVNLKFNIK
ncbi:MAG TPA: TonB-dependent receptor [Chitinophagaceae bacterium]|nr:TonB-dependent receptor [Chitinophagaceae bacterium]